jgi:hypothetical protein
MTRRGALPDENSHSSKEDRICEAGRQLNSLICINPLTLESCRIDRIYSGIWQVSLFRMVS